MEKSYDILLSEVKLMKVRVDKTEAKSDSAVDENGKTYDEKVQELAVDIEKLKLRLIEKDKDADKARTGRTVLQKSRSLEESSSKEMEISEYHLDLRMQMETVQQEARVLKEKMAVIERETDLLLSENKKLQIIAGRGHTSSKGITEELHTELSSRIRQLEAENVTLRDSVGQLDERASKLSKEVVPSEVSRRLVGRLVDGMARDEIASSVPWKMSAEP